MNRTRWTELADRDKATYIVSILKWALKIASFHVWINCECRGIVRNDIFPNTLPYKYPYLRVSSAGVYGYRLKFKLFFGYRLINWKS